MKPQREGWRLYTVPSKGTQTVSWWLTAPPTREGWTTEARAHVRPVDWKECAQDEVHARWLATTASLKPLVD